MKDEQKLESDLQAIKRIFIDYPKVYKAKLDELEKLNQERQDLLHVLELAKLDAIRMGKISRELKRVSVERRRVKNNLEALKAISDFSRSFNNNSNKIKQIQMATERVINIIQRERTYTMRVRTDLQELLGGEQ